MKRFAPLVLLLPAVAIAQIAPDAGRLLQEIHPAPALPAPKAPAATVEETAPAPLPDGATVAVRGFRITGATAFPEAALLPLVADAVGKELSLADLDSLAARITRHYRNAGYFVARAYLPAQEIADGNVEIAVLEGRIGKIEIDNQAGIAASALAPAGALTPGDVIHAGAMEEKLLALAELPGVEVKSTLRPGTAVGTSDFLVEVGPGRAFNGSVDVDSFGNRFTGAHRLGASLFWNNPAGLGDQASLRLQKSNGDFDYARVGYQLPFGAAGTRVGAAWSEMRYGLGKDFAPLDATGEASIGSLYLQHPILRSRTASLFGQVQFDDKRLTDRIDVTTTKTDKQLHNWTLGLNGNFIDGLGGGGNSTLALDYTTGRLELDSASDAIDAATARSAGSFSKWNLSFQRLQRVMGDVSLLLSVSGQLAGNNLDSSEKFVLGGAYGVRAYPQGEAAGDEGHLISAELRWQLAQAWQAQAFYDDGRTKINRDPWVPGSNRRHLAGYGVGAAWASDGFSLRLFAAWKAGTGAPTSDIDRSPRIWVQGAAYF
ncbi:MAG: hypothetical protein CVU34_20390 [Betaproteobacteria bacterium HGW-Betaproteobacteria-7]|jgi:hemolysin activation/secretion protein|nr:MAG: hypothetical protein CVU34_20390 [Betaproteobacteria bacterium HGW-Betaproteobacteria-7]